MTSSKQRSGIGDQQYKHDPAGEYTKRNLGETVYNFCKSFLDCNSWSQRLIAKSRVKSHRLRNEGEPGVNTESFWKSVVVPGFFESSCEQEYLIAIADDGFEPVA